MHLQPVCSTPSPALAHLRNLGVVESTFQNKQTHIFRLRGFLSAVHTSACFDSSPRRWQRRPPPYPPVSLLHGLRTRNLPTGAVPHLTGVPVIGRFSSCDPGRSQTGTTTSRVDWSSSGYQDRPASSSLRPRSAQARLQAGKTRFPLWEKHVHATTVGIYPPRRQKPREDRPRSSRSWTFASTMHQVVLSPCGCNHPVLQFVRLSQSTPQTSGLTCTKNICEGSEG